MGQTSNLWYPIGKTQDMSAPSFYEYRDYQVEDFVMDEAFQQWVRHPDPVSDQFWQAVFSGLSRPTGSGRGSE